MREIGEAVGINPGAIYHHFRSKRALVSELITGHLAELVEAYRARDLENLDPQSRLRAIVEVSLQVGAAHPDATKVYQSQFSLYRDDRDFVAARELSDTAQGIWLDAIEAGKSAGVFRKDIPTKVFHRFIRDAVWLSVYWHRPEDPYTIDHLANDCLAVFFDGMVVAAGRVE